MPRVNLTPSFVASAGCEVGKGKTEWFDLSVTGFTLECRSTGGRTYYLRYFDSTGRQRQFKIGRYEDLTFAAAKKGALQLRSEVVMGGDPSAKKAEAKSIPLYSEIAASHLAYAKLHLKSWASTEMTLRVHIVPKWGKVRVTVVEGKTERASLQRGLEAQVKSALQSQGQRNIGYPGGNQNAELFSNGAGQLWAAFANLPDASIPRRWNAFGVYHTESRSQQITVEINIPTEEASGQIAGFFARDPETGHVYLMHDGGIGGGKAGVGKEAFLTRSKITLEEALRSDGRVREGIIIGRVDTPDLPSRIWSFVQQVSDFKAAVRSGEFDTAAALADVDEWDDFKDEPTGRRRGTRSSAIDYVTYHGDVVRALRDKRQATCADDERVLNSRLIDLYVRCGAALTEVYEVKTSVDRQSIYTAIGQLMTHGPADGGSIKRVLALPPGQLAADLKHGLDALGITVQRFDVTGGKSPRVTLL